MSDEEEYLIETDFNRDDVRRFMSQHNMVIRDLAVLMGVTDQAVRYWLSGHRNVPETTKRIFVLFQKYPKAMEEF